MKQLSQIIWVTGLSASGKTTVSKALQKKLKDDHDIQTILLDGDDLRFVFQKENALKKEERLQLAYTYARLAKLLYDQGFFVIVATISMFEEVRQWNRNNIENYLEVYLKVSEEIRKQRNPKKLYDTIIRDDMVSFESHGYEEPQNPDIVFSRENSLSVEKIVSLILKKGIWNEN